MGLRASLSVSDETGRAADRWRLGADLMRSLSVLTQSNAMRYCVVRG